LKLITPEENVNIKVNTKDRELQCTCASTWYLEILSNHVSITYRSIMLYYDQPVSPEPS